MLITHITYRGDAKVHARELKGIISRALAFAIRWWHRSALPRHFEVGAGKRYYYGKRSKRYMIRKARSKGHQKPLTYTGDLKAQLTRRLEVKPLKTKAVATGRMKGPRYIHMKVTESKKHDLGAEILRTTQDEAESMAKMVDRRSTRALNKLKQSRSVAA